MSSTCNIAANRGQMETEDTEKLCHKISYNEVITLTYITVVFHTNGILFLSWTLIRKHTIWNNK